MARLLASERDRKRTSAARSIVLLVGGYDGSGNYGDVLQLAAAIRTVEALPDRPLPVAVVEVETAAHHATLVERHPHLLGSAAFAFFDEGEDAPPAGMVRLEEASAPDRTVLHLYGGGYLNRWWGQRKARHCEAALALAGRESLPTTASGLQVDREALAEDGPGRGLLAGADWIGVRDEESAVIVAEAVGDGTPVVSLCGDDALPLLAAGDRPEPDGAINLHLNAGTWVSDDVDAMLERIATLLGKAATGAARPIEVQPVVAYEDPRVSERAVVEAFVERHGAALAAAGVSFSQPLDVLDDASRRGLAGFRRASATLSCSYHVALTSLASGIPTVLFADNGYYDQKSAGLRDLFGTGAELLGVRGAGVDLDATVAAVVPGERRDAIAAALRGASAEVAALHKRSRDPLRVALAAGLRRSAAEVERTRAELRAATAEERLRGVVESRAWHWVARARRARRAIAGGIRRDA